MRIIDLAESEKAEVLPTMIGIKAKSLSVIFRLVVDLKPEADYAIVIRLEIGDEERKPEELTQVLEFEDCLPFEAIPEGAINLKTFAYSVDNTNALTAVSDGIEALLMAEAKLSIRQKSGEEDEDEIFFELRIGNFITYATGLRENLKELLVVNGVNACTT